MRLRTALALLGCALSSICCAADEPAAAPTPPVTSGDRVILGVDGATLTGTNGGVGGSAAYLHQETPNFLVGVGADYQRLATSNWSFGSLNVGYSHDMTASTRWNVHAEAHEGTGSTVEKRFNYSIVAAGLGTALPGGLATDIEERQIDVDTSHGSLPKVGLSKAWGRHLLTGIAYARSFGGNLDTSYSLARIDFYGPGFNLLAGGDLGRVSPAVININGVLTPQARHLDEAFFGITKLFERFDLTLLADNIELAGIRHITVTLDCTVHLR
jgi:hypothetical protein